MSWFPRFVTRVHRGPRVRRGTRLTRVPTGFVIMRSKRRGGAKGDGQFLLDTYGISPTNAPLGGALGDMGLASFLDLDAAIQYRYLPVFTSDYLEQAGYSPSQTRRIINYLRTRDPNMLGS